MWRWTKRILGAGLVAGAGYALWKVVDERSRSGSLEWTPQPFPSPPKPVPHETGTQTGPAPGAAVGWVAPEAGACPVTHPVKAKLGSGIFHVPGGQMYDRTVPDRCYRDAAAAEADGLRASKR
ncbi:MAG: hypothetical protein ACKOA9_06730 [Actinomycetota bacterium]